MKIAFYRTSPTGRITISQERGVVITMMESDKMTIDNFPITEQNRTDCEAAREVLSNPARFRTVFFHLTAKERLHFKCAMINSWQGQLSCHCVTVPAFIADMISRYCSGTYPGDLETYTAPDVLIVDDLQYAVGKEVTQETLYELLKFRADARKLTVLFSDLSTDHLQSSLDAKIVQLLNNRT